MFIFIRVFGHPVHLRFESILKHFINFSSYVDAQEKALNRKFYLIKVNHDSNTLIFEISAISDEVCFSTLAQGLVSYLFFSFHFPKTLE